MSISEINYDLSRYFKFFCRINGLLIFGTIDGSKITGHQQNSLALITMCSIRLVGDISLALATSHVCSMFPLVENK